MRTLLPLLALTACAVNVPEEPTTEVPAASTPAPTPELPTRPDTTRPPTSAPTAPAPSTPAPDPQDCPEDDFEPNDVQAVNASGSLLELTLSADDVDRFSVDLLPGDTVTIDADFLNQDGDLDLYLTRPDGELLSWSTTADDHEYIDFESTTAQTVWIETHLFEADADACLDYELSWSVQPATVTPPTPDPGPPPPPPAPVCLDDLNEPNQDWNAAPELLPVSDGYAIVDLTSNDDDWFYVYVTPEEQLDIIVRHDTPGAAIDLIAWDELGEIADAPVLAGSDTTLVVNGGSDGEYIDLLIAPLDPDTCAPYTITLISSPPTCAEDVFEPNDGVPAVVAPPLLDLTLFSGDVDRFDVTLLPGEELWVDAFFDHSYGNVDLELLDAQGYSVDSSFSNTDGETLAMFNDSPFAETFTIEAALYGATADTCQTLDLDWTIFGAACYDDAIEGDDTPAGAAELIPEFGTSIVYDLIADDDDWFWLEQLPGEELDLFVEHGTFGADLELIVYDAFGEVAYDVADLPGIEAHAPLFATAGATYDILVRPFDPLTCVPYSLTVVSF